MKSEAKPIAQMPTGNARHGAWLLFGGAEYRNSGFMWASIFVNAVTPLAAAAVHRISTIRQVTCTVNKYSALRNTEYSEPRIENIPST